MRICDLKIEERVFAKGLDIVPAIIAGEIDIAASAADAAIAGRAGGAPVFAVAGFARGGPVPRPWVTPPSAHCIH